jgi:hypothetical protein
MSETADQGDPDEIAQRQMMNLFLGTAQAYGGKWCEIFGGIADGRASLENSVPDRGDVIQWGVAVHVPVRGAATGQLPAAGQLGGREEISGIVWGSGCTAWRQSELQLPTTAGQRGTGSGLPIDGTGDGENRIPAAAFIWGLFPGGDGWNRGTGISRAAL